MSNKQFTINQRCTLHHCEGDIPAVVREINAAKTMVRIQIIGDKNNRPWAGLHWFPISSVTPISRPSWSL